MSMSLNVYAFTCGWLTLPAALLLAAEKGSLTVPLPSYLIEHPKGRAIFDSGLHLDTQTDPNRRLGRLSSFHTWDPTPARRSRRVFNRSMSIPRS